MNDTVPVWDDSFCTDNAHELNTVKLVKSGELYVIYIYHSGNILGWKKSPKAIPASGSHWLLEYEMLDVSAASELLL